MSCFIIILSCVAWVSFFLMVREYSFTCDRTGTTPFSARQREKQTVFKSHGHLHYESKNHANFNETVSFVVVIEKPFCVNYFYRMALPWSLGWNKNKSFQRFNPSLNCVMLFYDIICLW